MSRPSHPFMLRAAELPIENRKVPGTRLPRSENQETEKGNPKMASALTVSPRKAMEKYERATASLKRLREKGHEATETVVRSVETVASSFVMGGIQGRFGEVSVGPVPASLLTGLGLHGVGIVLGGKSASHMHAFGDGALCAWATTVGTGVGADLRKKSLASGMAGDYSDPSGTRGGGALTDAEQAALADSV